jgi:L-iditol 2-dehydrogenase
MSMARGGEIPHTMRISVLTRPGHLELQERPVPRPGPQEVLVAVRSVGICGSDAHYFQHGRIADFVVRGPLVLGHETSGRIVAVGDGVDGRRVGARVAIEPGTACLACAQCKAGRYNLCPRMSFFATPPVDGALAEYVVVRADLAFDLPDEVSDDAGALVEPLSVAIWATGKAAITAGSSVLVAGAGPIGLVTTQMARARGASTIVVTDVAPARLATAALNGATATLDARDGAEIPADFDAFLDCSGIPSAITAGVRALRPAGRAVLVGMGPDEVTLPLGLLQRRELTITGTFRYAGTWPTAISLAATGAVNLDDLITSRFALAEADQAIASTIERSSIKSIVEPWR